MQICDGLFNWREWFDQWDYTLTGREDMRHDPNREFCRYVGKSSNAMNCQDNENNDRDCYVYSVPLDGDGKISEASLESREKICDGCKGGRILIHEEDGKNRTISCKFGSVPFKCDYTCKYNEGTTTERTTTTMALEDGKWLHCQVN